MLAITATKQQGAMTSAEVLGYALLDRLGIQYRAQVVLFNKFCVDALVQDRAVVVQFDGDYWHGNLTRFPNPEARVIKRMRLDRSQDAYLRKAGFAVVRVWESDLKGNQITAEWKLEEVLKPSRQ